LQRVREVPAGIGKILKRRSIEICGGVGVRRIEERGFPADFDSLFGLREL